jgi:hypothetical protein
MTNSTRPNDNTEKLGITFTKSILARIEQNAVTSGQIYSIQLCPAEPVRSSRIESVLLLEEGSHDQGMS